MQRERRYRSKLLYLVRTSLEVCVDPQAECMQVVWGPWKLRTRRGMGITGMGGLLEPGTVHWGYWCRPLPVLLPGRQLASFAWTIWLDLDPLPRRWFPPSFTQEGFFFPLPVQQDSAKRLWISHHCTHRNALQMHADKILRKDNTLNKYFAHAFCDPADEMLRDNDKV